MIKVLNKDLLELVLMTKLDILFSRFEKYLNESSDMKAVTTIVGVGTLFIIINIVLLKVMNITVKYMLGEVYDFLVNSFDGSSVLDSIRNIN